MRIRARGEVTILGTILISALTCLAHAWLGILPVPTAPSSPPAPTTTTTR